MPHKPTLTELYAKRDRGRNYVAKLQQRQRALGDKIKADEKLLDSFRAEISDMLYAHPLYPELGEHIYE